MNNLPQETNNPSELDPKKINYHLKKDLEGDKKIYNTMVRYAERNFFLQRADAEDLVSDVYTHLIDIGNKGYTIKSPDSDKTLFSFLYACMRTNQKSNLRRLKRKKEVFNGFYKTIQKKDLCEPSPEIGIMRAEQSEKLTEIIDSLRKPHRTALKLRLDGTSYLQISEKEHIGIEITKSRIYQAKKRLRDRLLPDQFD
jgi:RNA polymerase sigma factor (sigma-70 family)